MGNWNTAIDYFEKAKAVIPQDFTTNILINRCTYYIDNPPDNWDGAVTLNFK